MRVAIVSSKIAAGMSDDDPILLAALKRAGHQAEIWNWDDPGNAGLLLPHREAIEIWEENSGLKVDMETFWWWRVFASIKGIAIWISSSEDFQNGAGKDSILAMAGWAMTDRQNRILLDYLSPHSENKFSGGLL